MLQSGSFRDPHYGAPQRFLVHESVLRKAIHAAARKARIAKSVGPHTLRHCFATDLLAAGYDIRTVQEFLSHKDSTTTMIYTHVLNRGGRSVVSPGRSPMTGGLAIDVLTREGWRVNKDGTRMSQPPYPLECMKESGKHVRPTIPVFTREAWRGLPVSLIRLIQS